MPAPMPAPAPNRREWLAARLSGRRVATDRATRRQAGALRIWGIPQIAGRVPGKGWVGLSAKET